MDAGKVMSLAAYGKKKDLHLISNKNLYDLSDLRKPKFKEEVTVDNKKVF